MAMDATTIKEALKNRHEGASWAYFNELRTKTGYSGHIGYIDAYAVGLWESNRSFIAYEVKVSRADFKNDISSFKEKQSVALRNSTQFFFVCPHGLIKPDEVPEQCGLMEVNAGGTKVVKVAQLRDLKDGCLDIEFNRSLLRENSGEPIKKSKLWKYVGQEMTEDEVMEVAKSVSLVRNEYEIKAAAERMIKEEKDKAWKILDTFANIVGYGYELHNGELDKIATKLAAEFIKKRDLIWRSQGIMSNVENIKRLITELEAAANEAIDKNITKNVDQPVPL